MKIKDYIIIVLIIVVSFFSYHSYAKKGAVGVSKDCTSGVEDDSIDGFTVLTVSIDISAPADAQAEWDKVLDKVENITRKLKLSSIVRESENYTVQSKFVPKNKGADSAGKTKAFKVGGTIIYESESADALSLLMVALLEEGYDRVVYSLAKYKGCQ